MYQRISEGRATDLRGKIIGAVADYSLGGWDHAAQRNLVDLLNQEPTLPAFSSGLLARDTESSHSCGVMRRHFDFMTAHPAAVPFHD